MAFFFVVGTMSFLYWSRSLRFKLYELVRHPLASVPRVPNMSVSFSKPAHDGPLFCLDLYRLGMVNQQRYCMPQRSEELTQSSLAEILGKMSEKGYALNFDVTLELATPTLKVGTVRVHGKLESAALKKR